MQTCLAATGHDIRRIGVDSRGADPERDDYLRGVVRMIVRIVRLLASSKALFVAAVITGAISGLGLSFGSGTHTVIAQFTNVNGLISGNEVRIGGIEVGTCPVARRARTLRPGEQYAQVAFTVDNAHWPLRQGTPVAVRPKGVLSNVYVDVEPGLAQRPVAG